MCLSFPQKGNGIVVRSLLHGIVLGKDWHTLLKGSILLVADDSAEDYGVSMGATYNPEITFSVTVDTTTGINTIKATTKDGKAIYNLKGVKVNKAAHGVFIVNGKKQIVK